MEQEEKYRESLVAAKNQGAELQELRANMLLLEKVCVSKMFTHTSCFGQSSIISQSHPYRNHIKGK